MRILRCAAVLLLLGLAAGALPAAAAAPRSERSFAEDRTLSDGTRLFHRLWGFVTSVWSEAGCTIDPLGGCRTSTTGGGNADEGCGIDPLGKPAPISEAGCIMDPLGGCKPRP